MSQMISLVLNEEMTPVSTFTTKVEEFENRLTKIENALAAIAPERVDTLEAELSAIQTDVANLKQSAASASELEGVQTSVQTVQEQVATLEDRLSGFSFGCGDVAAYEAAGALEPQQMFVIVDTPANLDKVSASTSGTTQDLAFSVAVGW